MKRKPDVRECRKRYDGECRLCGERDYALLDAHRVVPGEAGGTYCWENLVTLCANCHRRVHAGRVRLLARLKSTAGPCLHLVVDGEERFLFEEKSA